MARTWAHRPEWVQRFDPTKNLSTYIAHDHTTNPCHIETANDAKLYAAGITRPKRYNHFLSCNKTEKQTTYCEHTTTDPNVDPNHCDISLNEILRHFNNHTYLTYLPHTPICNGHTTYPIIHPDAPCKCDVWNNLPQCEVRWNVGYAHLVSKVYGEGPPTEFRRIIYTRPERRRVKNELRLMKQQYNANNDYDDIEDNLLPTRVNKCIREWF